MPGCRSERRRTALAAGVAARRRASTSTALFAALREEVRRSGADPGGGTGDPADRRGRATEAERLWPVSADRSLRLRPGVRGGIGTPVKAVLRKLMRWYVEPLAYDQRSFNAAALRLIDDLQEQVDRLEAEVDGAARREALAAMRIAVCQAPGAVRAGGASRSSRDALVEELRARDHEADLVTVPFKWYPGARVLTQAFLWRLLDLTEADGQADRHRRRDEVPLLSRPPSREARLARAPVSPGVRARRHRARPVLRVARGPGAAPAGAGARPRRARRGDASVRHVAERRGPARALDRASSPKCSRTRRRSSPYRDDGHGDFVLSVNRLDRAKRIDLLLEAAALTTRPRGRRRG